MISFILHPSDHGPSAYWTATAGSRLTFRTGLKMFRKSRKLTQKAFADSIGYSVGRYNRLEVGAVPITLRAQAAILAAYQPVKITVDLQFMAGPVEVLPRMGLKAIMAKHGWNRDDLARLLCVSPASVHNWLEGRTTPPMIIRTLYLYQELGKIAGARDALREAAKMFRLLESSGHAASCEKHAAELNYLLGVKP